MKILSLLLISTFLSAYAFAQDASSDNEVVQTTESAEASTDQVTVYDDESVQEALVLKSANCHGGVCSRPSASEEFEQRDHHNKISNSPSWDIEYIVPDSSSGDDGQKDCFLKGNDIFKNLCNVFQDMISAGTISETLKQNSSWGDIVNHFNKTSKSALLSEREIALNLRSSQQECDRCLGKTYSEINNDGDFDQNKDEVEKLIVEELKKEAVKSQLYKLTSDMEKALRLNAIYGHSLDETFKNESDASSKKAALLCNDPTKLEKLVRQKCGDQQEQEALAVLKNSLVSIGAGSDQQLTLTSLFNGLQENLLHVSSKKNPSCVLGLDNHQQSLYQFHLWQEKNKPGQTKVSKTYTILNKMMDNEEVLQAYCRPGSKPDEKIENPLGYLRETILNETSKTQDQKKLVPPYLKEEFVKLLASVEQEIAQTNKSLEGVVSEERINEIKRLSVYGDYAGKDLETVKEEILLDLYRGEVIEKDPNLNVIFSNWSSFCEFSQNKKDSNQTLQQFIENGHPEGKNSIKTHKRNVAKFETFQKEVCAQTYENLASLSCLEPDENHMYTQHFSSEDLDEAKLRVFDKINAKASNSESEKIRKDIVSLSALSCSVLHSKKDTSITNPKRFDFNDRSSYFNRHTHSSPQDLFTLSAQKDAEQLELLCSDKNSAVIKGFLDYNIYGIKTQGLDKTITDLVDEHPEIFSGSESIKKYYTKTTGRQFPETAILSARKKIASVNSNESSNENSESQKTSSSSTKSFNDDNGSNGLSGVANAFRNLGNFSNPMQPSQGVFTPSNSRADTDSVKELEQKTDILTDMLENNKESASDSKYQQMIDKLLKQNKELRDQLYTKIDKGEADSNDLQNLKNLEKQVRELEDSREKLLANKQSQGANQIGRQVANSRKPSSFDRSQIEAERLMSNFKSVRDVNSKGQVSYAPAQATQLNYKNGSSIVLTENAGNAVLRLKELTQNDIEEIKKVGIDVINGADGPRLVKIPGHTNYMEFRDLKEFLEKPENQDLRVLFEDLKIFDQANANVEEKINQAPKEVVLSVQKKSEDLVSLSDLKTFLKQSLLVNEN